MYQTQPVYTAPMLPYYQENPDQAAYIQPMPTYSKFIIFYNNFF